MDKTNFFSDGSPYLSHPLLTRERTIREIDFILAQIELPTGSRILDVGCGPGRHSAEFAQRGYLMVGIDPSSAMINAARKRTKSIHPTPKFIRTRAEEFTAESPFDTAICLYTTLGQIEDSRDNRGLVENITLNLRPEAFFIVEVPNFQWVKGNLISSERIGNENQFTQITRSFNHTDSTITETFDLIYKENCLSYLLRYRLYELFELKTILDKAGFQILQIFGGYEDIPVSDNRPMVVIISKYIHKIQSVRNPK